MRTEKEIDDALKKLDEEMQRNAGDCNESQLKCGWIMRAALLWAKGELDNLE